MPPRRLPENSSLENLRKQAKGLLKSARAGDGESLARIREFHPRPDDVGTNFSLAGAQLVIARGYGFASWPKLKEHVELVQPFILIPPADPPSGKSDSLVEDFLRLACLTYEAWRPSWAEKAREILAEHPEVAAASIYTASTVGDVTAVRRFLDHDPRLLNAKGGTLRWEPLLYACYSRLNSTNPNHSTLEVARLLLSRGADPNAGFLWRGNLPPFTALTGAFGNGELNVHEPPHEQCAALARLLLDAGADPNDEQALYNRHFQKSDDHLHLLLAYGLGTNRNGPWFKRFGDRLHSPARLLVEELWSAARKNFPDRVRLLIEHGTDLNTPGMRDGRTPYQAAVRAGNDEIAEYLLAHGARRIEPSREERFAIACINGRREEALAVLEEDPRHIERLGPHGRIELLHRAVEADRPAGIRLMAELGFELSGVTKHDGVGVNLAATPMHNAAWGGNLEMVRLLIELGADPNIRDPNYAGTPLDWAAYNKQPHVVEYLAPLTGRLDPRPGAQS